MPGINRAVLQERQQRANKSYYQRDPYDANRACVFISYRGADIDMALAVAKVLRDNEIDIWLDQNDALLTVANQTGNHAEVVRRIEAGIAESTHILAIISERTKESWWVSYEIGSGRRKGAEVAYIPRDNVQSLPSYLQIAVQIKTDLTFFEWLRRGFSAYMTKVRYLESKSISIPGIPISQRGNIPFYDQG